MPDKPEDPTPEQLMEQKMAELETMKAELSAQKAEITAQRDQSTELNRTMAGLTDAIRQQNTPEPAPDPALEGEFDEATVRAAAALSKKQLEAYHNEIAPAIQDLRAGQFESEWERARRDDPKNFGRLEQTMRKHFDSKPELKQPGAVGTLFTQMKGHHYNKLQEMDRAERQKEIDNPEPNPTTPVHDKKSTKVDELNEEEWKLIRGMGREHDGTPNVSPEHYYLAKHGKWPNFGDQYLEAHGYEPVERSS